MQRLAIEEGISFQDFREHWADIKAERINLTQEQKYLEYISPFDVIMEPIQAPIGQAYRATIDWIDEYTTKQQWDEIYENSIHPRQISFWEKRGELQHSR